MSKVFGAIMLRRHRGARQPAATSAGRRASTPSRRGATGGVRLAGRHWNIFSRATLGNTRAVVRYLARYTSRIAMGNRRITGIDEEKRTVTFEMKDYRHGRREQEIDPFRRGLPAPLQPPPGSPRVPARAFLWDARRSRRPAPRDGGRARASIGEKTPGQEPRNCANCGSTRFNSLRLRQRPGEPRPGSGVLRQLVELQILGRYSLVPPDSG